MLYFDEPIAIRGVPALQALQVFDGVYAAVRGAPFKQADRSPR